MKIIPEKKKRKKRTVKHGLTNHPLYGIWSQMKYRCMSPKSVDYKHYGGRGVKVCDEWVNNFLSFYQWAISNGWQKGLSLDKDIKAKKLGLEPLIYSPEFCSLVTQKENVQNTRITKIDTFKAFEIRNSNKSVLELMQLYNVSRRTINSIKSNSAWI